MRRIIFTNNKKLNYNKYTLGSGVGGVSNSNRNALKRRATNCCSNSSSIIIESGIQYIKVFFRETDGIIQISQLAVYSNGINIAPNGIASAANTYNFGSSINFSIDGTLSAREFPNIYHSYEPSGFGYWLLDLGQEFAIDQIVYYNRISDNTRAIGMLIETYDKTYNNNLPNNSVYLNQLVLNSDLIQFCNL